MLEVNCMRGARIDARGRGESRAALLAAALVLSGCSSASTPASTTDSGPPSRFTSLFSGSASPPAQAAAPAGPSISPDDCPSVQIRTGAGTLAVGGKPGEASAPDVRYELSFSQVARQCTLVGTDVVMKVGVQGRIVTGPAGGPGPVDVPLRYAVVQEGPNPKTITTKFKRVGAAIPPDQSNTVFSDVEENLSFPMPSHAVLDAYIVYVGFDEIGDAPEKKPVAKKPVAKRQ
jgi:hypothetical protein